MDEVSVVVRGTNLTAEDSPLVNILPTFDGLSENGPFEGDFVPPPPRPLFLDEGATPDGLTTCDLCSWAWQSSNIYQADANSEAPGELGWVLTLIIVSLISAVVGAIVMIVVLHCKRLKNTEQQERRPPTLHLNANNRPPMSIPDDKSANATISGANLANGSSAANMSGVWSWLSRRSAAAPSQLANSPANFAENHYTHMEDGYNSVGDALYAELDAERDSNASTPAYQNSAYTDPDAATSSAPSSAYYSDLSVTATTVSPPGERAYEVVGLSTWESVAKNRLTAISENVNVPSDYV